MDLDLVVQYRDLTTQQKVLNLSRNFIKNLKVNFMVHKKQKIKLQDELEKGLVGLVYWGGRHQRVEIRHTNVNIC